MFFFFQLAQILPDERVFCRAAPSGTPVASVRIGRSLWQESFILSCHWPINAADPPGDLENLQLSFEHTGVHSQYFWKKNIKETDPKIKNMFT